MGDNPSSQFTISKKVSNFFIYSQRDMQNKMNDNINENNNVIAPKNLISFEYNLSQRKQNNTTRNIENNKLEKDKEENNKLSNEVSIKEEIKDDNNKLNEFIYKKNHKNDKRKIKCFCCL